MKGKAHWCSTLHGINLGPTPRRASDHTTICPHPVLGESEPGVTSLQLKIKLVILSSNLTEKPLALGLLLIGRANPYTVWSRNLVMGSGNLRRMGRAALAFGAAFGAAFGVWCRCCGDSCIFFLQSWTSRVPIHGKLQSSRPTMVN